MALLLKKLLGETALRNVWNCLSRVLALFMRLVLGRLVDGSIFVVLNILLVIRTGVESSRVSVMLLEMW